MSNNGHIKSYCADRIFHLHDRVRNTRLKHLFFYGFIHCDISKYEEYTIIELIEEFCEEVPTFFKTYDDLYLLFTHRWENCDRAFVQLQTDLLSPPAGFLQAKIARIIHSYFRGLPWFSNN